MFSRTFFRFSRANGTVSRAQEFIGRQHSSSKFRFSSSSQATPEAEGVGSSWYSKFKPTSWFDYSILLISGCGCAWFLHRLFYIQQAKSIDELMAESKFEEAARLLENRLSQNQFPWTGSTSGEGLRFTKGATAKLLECYGMMQDLPSAAHLILRMIDAFPEDAIQNRMDLAYVYIHGKQYPSALEQLVRVIETSPAVADSVRNAFKSSTLPSINRFRGLDEDAIAKLSDAENALVLDGIAAVFVYMSMYPEADLVYAISLQLNANAMETQYAHAAVKFAQDQLVDAQAMLERLVEQQQLKESIRVKAVHTLVDVYSIQKNYSKAVGLCGKQAKVMAGKNTQFSLEMCKSRVDRLRKEHS